MYVVSLLHRAHHCCLANPINPSQENASGGMPFQYIAHYMVDKKSW